jgi:hypothetical protein
MKYMALIYGDEIAYEALSEEEKQADYGLYDAFGQVAGARAPIGEALYPTNTAKTVRVRNGQVMTSDGPFAETKEQLGGFYLLECDSMEEALELAAQIPDAKRGCVEVRPVVKFD